MDLKSRVLYAAAEPNSFGQHFSLGQVLESCVLACCSSNARFELTISLRQLAHIDIALGGLTGVPFLFTAIRVPAFSAALCSFLT